MDSPGSLLSQIIDQSPFGIGLIDYEGYFRKVNASYCAQYGYTVEELTGRHYTLILPRQHQVRLLARHQAFLRGEEDYDGEFGVVHRDGSEHRVLIASRKLVTEGGERLRMVSLLNFDARKRMELELERSRRFTQGILDGLDARVCVVDQRGMILAVNEHWRRFEYDHGVPATHRFEDTDLLGSFPGQAQAKASATDWIAGLIAVLEGQAQDHEAEYSVGVGEQTRWFVVRISRMPVTGPARFVIAHDDVTGIKRLQEALALKASTDELTGLANRRTAMERLAGEHARIRRHPALQACLLALDIDHFKRVNDTRGHAAGDAALRHVARLMCNAVRTTDLTGRIGGEEFLILLPDTDLPGALSLAERIRAEVQNRPAAHEGREIALTVSIGVSAILQDDARSQDALERADQALYAAKHAGRNRVIARP